MKITETMALAAKKLAIQMVIETASKDTANPYFKSKYADLCEVVNTIKKAMVDSGAYLLIEQFPHTAYGEPGKAPMVTVTTRVTDVDSGECDSFDLSSLPAQDTPQAIGSTITYLRRYSLMPVFGVVPEDDDGNSASGKKDDMDQRRPDDRKPPQTAPQTRQPSQRQAPATAAPAAANPRPTGRTVRGRAAPAATPAVAPTEPPPEDDLPWHDDPAQPGTTPPLPDQNKLVEQADLLRLKAARTKMKVDPDKMCDYCMKEFKKDNPVALSVAELNSLIAAINNTPEVVNAGLGF